MRTFDIYFGTYTRASSSRGIYRSELVGADPVFAEPTLAAEVSNPGYLALSPDGRRLYCVAEESQAVVSAFERKPDGSLQLLNSQSTGGEGACHLAVDPSGRVVVVSNYRSGDAASFPVRPDGSLGGRASFHAFSGSGPNVRRQKAPHAHGAFFDRSGARVYICDLGTDRIWIFKVDRGTGEMTSNEPSFCVLPAGGGPRHLAFHPGGRFAFCNLELTQEVVSLVVDPASGALRQQACDSSHPAAGETKPGGTTAALRCHPSGNFLYCSNRGTDTIAVYRVSNEGRLSPTQFAPSGVETPRDFNLCPRGELLIAGGENDNRVALHHLDPATGELSQTGHSIEVPRPVCVLPAPRV